MNFWWLASEQLLGELGVPQDTTVLKIDNTAAEAISKDDKHHQRTRAIRLRHHHIRDEVAKRTVRPEHENTLELESDALTKSLTQKQFEYLRQKLLGQA